MKSAYAISYGTAIIQVHTDKIVPDDKINSPNFVLTIKGDDGRSGTMSFWTGDAISMGGSCDHINGLMWTVFGSGYIAKKVRNQPHLSEVTAYGVIALWPVENGAVDEFADLGKKNVLASVELEPGCEAFGIFRSTTNPTVFVLVEVFDSMGSFSRHLETEHFRQFAEYARPRYVGDRSQTVKGVPVWE